MQKVLLVVAALIILFAGAMYYNAGTAGRAYIPQTPDKNVTAVSSAEKPEETSPLAPAVEPAAASEDNLPVSLDIRAALEPRSMGNPDAPVKIEEFASLSCPHCADFYKETFPKIRKKYIDTGKVYFTYTDFPTNAPALEGAMLARCLASSHYFQFIEFLFENQEQWAFGKNPHENLRQNAKLAGMGDATFNACLENQALKEGIATRMKEKSERHKISSTPSFLLNGEKVLAGSLSIETFDREISALLEQASAEDSPSPDGGHTE